MNEIIPAIGYAISTTILSSPFDTVKTRLQSGMYSNTFECFNKTFKNEGIIGLYRSSTIPMFSHIIKRLYQFHLFNYLTKNCNINPYISGLICGTTGSILCTPLQMIKVNIQSTTRSEYKNSFQFTSNLYTNQGLRGFYKGIQINCLKDGLFSCLFLGNYNIMKLYFENTWYNNFLLGGISNSLSWTILIPLDYIKTQIQIDSTNKKNISNILVNIHKNKNYRVLWYGLFPTLCRVFPVSGISMLTYELLKLYIV